MRTRIVFLSSAVLLVLCLIAGPTAGFGQSCTNASFNGSYGFVVRDLETNGGFVEAGRIDADGAGNFSEVVTAANNGTITRNVRTSGTYSINANCSGTAQTGDVGGRAFGLIVLPGGNSIATTATLASAQNGLGEMRRISQACSSGSLKGIFFSVEEGRFYTPTILFPPSLPHISNFGAFVADGAGNASGDFTDFIGGPESGTFSASYSVNSDCTGSLNGTISHPFSSVEVLADFVIAGDGSTLYAVITSTNDGNCTVISCSPIVYIVSQKVQP